MLDGLPSGAFEAFEPFTAAFGCAGLPFAVDGGAVMPFDRFDLRGVPFGPERPLVSSLRGIGRTACLGIAALGAFFRDDGPSHCKHSASNVRGWFPSRLTFAFVLHAGRAA